MSLISAWLPPRQLFSAPSTSYPLPPTSLSLSRSLFLSLWNPCAHLSTFYAMLTAAVCNAIPCDVAQYIIYTSSVAKVSPNIQGMWSCDRCNTAFESPDHLLLHEWRHQVTDNRNMAHAQGAPTGPWYVLHCTARHWLHVYSIANVVYHYQYYYIYIYLYIYKHMCTWHNTYMVAATCGGAAGARAAGGGVMCTKA